MPIAERQHQREHRVGQRLRDRGVHPPGHQHAIEVAHDQVRRLHRDLVDDAGEAEHLEQRDGAGDHRAAGTQRRRVSCFRGRFERGRRGRWSSAIPRAAIFHNRAVIAPNSACSMIRLSRSRGQCVSTTSISRPGRADITPMRSASIVASSSAWVIRNTVAPVSPPHPQQLVAHQQACLLVERAERLVEQDQPRLHHQRARDAHALAHAARELRRIAGREIGEA